MADDLTIKEYLREVIENQRKQSDGLNDLRREVSSVSADQKTMFKKMDAFEARTSKMEERHEAHLIHAATDSEQQRADRERIETLERKSYKGNGVPSHETRIQRLETSRDTKQGIIERVVPWLSLIAVVVMGIVTLTGGT